jgi:predicted nuclease of predicted toxin-antitoxin system
MKFIADMPVSPQTVSLLKTLDHDAVHAFDLGLAEAEDEEIAAFAKQEGRVVLTMDLDFGALLARSGDVEPGVIILRLNHATPAKVNRLLANLLSTVPSSEIEGSIVIVEEHKVRIRQLPVGKGKEK